MFCSDQSMDPTFLWGSKKGVGIMLACQVRR